MFQPKTVRELLNWSYASLAAYQVALEQNPPRYSKICWIVRSKLYKGLQTGRMQRQSIYLNERVKLAHSNRCVYCGAMDVFLTLDHLFPKARGGSDSGDNLVYCCQSCNSSKGDRDYFEWITDKGWEVNVSVAERYLKNAFTYCEQHELLDLSIEDAPSDLPFDLRAVPTEYFVKTS